MNDILIQEPLLSATIAFFIALFTGPVMISYLRKLKFGQNVRSEGPERHLQKSGTPTMGGVMILLALTAAVLLVGGDSGHLPMMLFATLGFGVIGFIDDLINILTRRSLGLRARQKLVIQIAIAVLVGLYALTQEQIGTTLLVPFISANIDLNPIIYVLLVVGVIVGSANAVNLTDGLDGLAAGSMAVVASAYVIISMIFQVESVSLFAGAVAGACLGFSWFNAHPAAVFMGDTGSLGLGAALGVMAVFTRTSLLLPIVGGLFVIETLSVIWQVAYFKLTKGRRFFKMAPLHHHFELIGWEEPKVMIRFWLLSLFFAVMGLFAVL